MTQLYNFSPRPNSANCSSWHNSTNCSPWPYSTNCSPWPYSTNCSPRPYSTNFSPRSNSAYFSSWLNFTTILPILFLYLNTVTVTAGTFERNESGRFGALKSDSTHHSFRNACTKSGSLRFSQFSGCWLILSVYIIMSFDFPFVRLFGVR